MLNETKKYPVIVSSSEDAHKLQEDEVALCCCEYVDEHGTKRHLLQTFCECVELDEFVSSALDEGISWCAFWNTLQAVDSRVRLPTWSGAKHVGLAFVFAVLAAGILYIVLSINLSLAIVSLCILPVSVYHISRVVLRTFPRTRFFYFFGCCCVLILILCTLVNTTKQFYAAKCGAVVAFFVVQCCLLHKIRNTRVSGDAVLSWSRCRACGSVVADRDHHCVWLNCCIDAANNDYFLAFVLCGSLALILALLCDVDLIHAEMNGAILYRTSLTLLLLLINFSTLFMKCYKKTRKRR